MNWRQFELETHVKRVAGQMISSYRRRMTVDAFMAGGGEDGENGSVDVAGSVN